jgi:hypothetical protein
MLLSNRSVKCLFFEKNNFLLKIEGFTGLNCQYLSTCITNVTCLNGGLCTPGYDVLSRSPYFVCTCTTGYVIYSMKKE